MFKKFLLHFNTIRNEYIQVANNKKINTLINSLVIILDIFIIFVVSLNILSSFIGNGSLLTIVQGNSMYPTLNSSQIIFADNNRNFKRGDIVTAKFPESALKMYPEFKGQKIVKRIIGVPGDQIVINKNGVYINNQKIEEEYLTEDAKSKTYNNSEYNSVLLSDNQYFLMGDNRGHSSDSRLFGVFDKNNILYKQSEHFIKNTYIKLGIIIIALVFEILIFLLIEFILRELAYFILYKTNGNNENNPNFKNNITTSETVFIEGRNK